MVTSDLLANVFDSHHRKPWPVVSGQHFSFPGSERRDDGSLTTDHPPLTTVIITIADADPKVGVTHSKVWSGCLARRWNKSWDFSYFGVGEAAWAASSFFRRSSERAAARLPATSACFWNCTLWSASPFMSAILADSSNRFVLYDQADSLLGSNLIEVSASCRPCTTQRCILS